MKNNYHTLILVIFCNSKNIINSVEWLYTICSATTIVSFFKNDNYEEFQQMLGYL